MVLVAIPPAQAALSSTNSRTAPAFMTAISRFIFANWKMPDMWSWKKDLSDESRKLYAT